MATDLFISIPFRRPYPELSRGSLRYGSSDTATDWISLRMQINTGSAATGLTREDVRIALEVLAKAVDEGGLTGDGTGVPPPTTP